LGVSIFYPVAGGNYQGYDDLTFSQQNVAANASWSNFLVTVKQQGSSKVAAPDISQSKATNLQLVPNQPAAIDVVVSDPAVAAISVRVVRKSLPGNSVLNFDMNGDMKFIIPAVELPNNKGGIDTYKVTLTLVDKDKFIFALSDYANSSPVSDRLAATFDSATGKLHLPIVDVQDEVLGGMMSFMVDLQLVDAEHWLFQIVNAQNAERYMYLSEVMYQSIGGEGTYPITWEGNLPTLSGDGGVTKAFLSGFFQSADSELMSSFALYTPPDTQDVQLVILSTNLKTGEVINALDGGLLDQAPRGIELQPGGMLIPLYYSEIRVGDDPDNWEAEAFTSEVVVTIPPAGLSGLKVMNGKVDAGQYTLEIVAKDVYANSSKVQEYAVTIQ
jgi:hypothetical protein